MGKLKITGGIPLFGEVKLQTSKNALLPMLAAGLLCEESVTFHAVPGITDVNYMLCVLRSMGAKIRFHGKSVTVDYSQIQSTANETACGKLRASVFLLGPLLGRFCKGEVLSPGGCPIGARPLDIHEAGFRAMGASFSQGETVRVAAEKLRGAQITLRMPSVGATVNLLCAAVKAEGETVLTNAAKEPEVVDLARFLRSMGAEIKGEGTPRIVIRGVKKLHGTVFTAQKDRIEGGTFLSAIAASGGEGGITGVNPAYFSSVLEIFAQTTCKIWVESDKIYIRCPSGAKTGVNVVTGPYPAFPTDMQSLLIPYLTGLPAESRITETLFENRFSCAEELQKMGAMITLSGRTLTVAPAKLTGAKVTAKDLRAAAGLAVGALKAEGESEILGTEHLLRGYENFAGKIRRLGGKARLIP